HSGFAGCPRGNRRWPMKRGAGVRAIPAVPSATRRVLPPQEIVYHTLRVAPAANWTNGPRSCQFLRLQAYRLRAPTAASPPPADPRAAPLPGATVLAPRGLPAPIAAAAPPPPHPRVAQPQQGGRVSGRAPRGPKVLAAGVPEVHARPHLKQGQRQARLLPFVPE